MKDAVGKSQTFVPVVLKIDGDLITDSLSIATRVNIYFTNKLKLGTLKTNLLTHQRPLLFNS